MGGKEREAWNAGRGAGLGPGGITHWALSRGSRTQAAPAGSARSFPGCPPSPASSSENSAPGPREMDNQDQYPAGCLSTAPLPGARCQARGGRWWVGCSRPAPPGLSLGPLPVPAIVAPGPARPSRSAPRDPYPRPPSAPALTSLPSSGKMSPLSCLKLSLMRARRRFSSSGFRLCERVRRPARLSVSQTRALPGRSARSPQSPAPTLRSSAGSPALRGSPMLDGEAAPLLACRVGVVCLPRRGAESDTQREVG